MNAVLCGSRSLLPETVKDSESAPEGRSSERNKASKLYGFFHEYWFEKNFRREELLLFEYDISIFAAFTDCASEITEKATMIKAHRL